MARTWWRSDSCGRVMSGDAATYVSKYVSETVIDVELGRVQRYALEKESDASDDSDESSSDDEVEFELHVSRAARQVVALYETSDIELGLVITLPATYPLGMVDVQSTSRLGVSDAQWRRWLLSITSIFMTQDGSVLDACLLWKSVLDQHLEGVENCVICYSVQHHATNALPNLPCGNCSAIFHSACLYTWFSTSGESKCPLCSHLF